MKYKIFTIYAVINCFLGIYGMLFSPFVPAMQVDKFALYFSIAFFLFMFVVMVFWGIGNRSNLIIRFGRPFNFYFFIFAGIPALLAFITLLHYGAWSRGIPSLYTLYNVEPDIVISKITDKRAWGKNDRRREIFISEYFTGFPVSKRYYESVNLGQTVKIAIRKSEWGTHLEFL